MQSLHERPPLQDDYYLDGMALNLHSFYAGIERLFEMIVETVDGSVPQGADWHQLLVEQMAREIPDIRPAVLTGEAVTYSKNIEVFVILFETSMLLNSIH